jgi:hypothetical protein
MVEISGLSRLASKQQQHPAATNTAVLPSTPTHGQMLTEPEQQVLTLWTIFTTRAISFVWSSSAKVPFSNCIGAGTRAQGHTESSTGTNMLTLATDQTFEFLFAVAQVSKMVLLEK